MSDQQQPQPERPLKIPRMLKEGHAASQETPAAAKNAQQIDEIICLEHPRIINRRFDMGVKSEKKPTKGLPSSTCGFKELAGFNYEQERAFHFVDNTMMLRGIMEEHEFKYMHVAGPPRSGKSINLSMFGCFLDGYCSNNEQEKKENRRLFEGLDISKDGEFCQKHQQQYYVISLSFGGLCSASSIAEMYCSLAIMMCLLYRSFKEACENPSFSKHLTMLIDFISDAGKEDIVRESLSKLAMWLKDSANAKGHPMKIVLLIDEFDKPYTAAIDRGADMYAVFEGFMDKFFSGIEQGLFDFVYFTGVRRVPFPTGSHCFNALKVFSIFDRPFHQWHGFTDKAMDKLLEETHLSEYKEEFQLRYGGYTVQDDGKGDTDPSFTCNPFAVIRAIHFKELANHWAKVCGNFWHLFNELESDKVKTSVCEKFYKLIRFGEVDLTEFGLLLPPPPPKNTCSDEKELWINLLQSGFIKIQSIDGVVLAKTFNWGTLEPLCWFAKRFCGSRYAPPQDMPRALIERDIKEFTRLLLNALSEDSPRSPRSESMHCLLVFTFLTCNECNEAQIQVIRRGRRAKSNSFDLAIRCKKDNVSTVYVFEIKHLEPKAIAGDGKSLRQALEAKVSEVLVQMQSNSYDDQLLDETDTVIRIGIAFAKDKFVLGYQMASGGDVEYIDLRESWYE